MYMPPLPSVVSLDRAGATARAATRDPARAPPEYSPDGNAPGSACRPRGRARRRSPGRSPRNTGRRSSPDDRPCRPPSRTSACRRRLALYPRGAAAALDVDLCERQMECRCQLAGLIEVEDHVTLVAAPRAAQVHQEGFEVVDGADVDHLAPAGLYVSLNHGAGLSSRGTGRGDGRAPARASRARGTRPRRGTGPRRPAAERPRRGAAARTRSAPCRSP